VLPSSVESTMGKSAAPDRPEPSSCTLFVPNAQDSR
jgi:hypothetical protein